MSVTFLDAPVDGLKVVLVFALVWVAFPPFACCPVKTFDVLLWHLILTESLAEPFVEHLVEYPVEN